MQDTSILQSLWEFLKSFWGYTIIGGVSLGAVISLVVLNIKTIILSKRKSDDLQHASDEAKVTKATTDAKDAYYQDVINMLFQSITFIVMASKLSKEDKSVLLKGIEAVGSAHFTDILNDKLSKIDSAMVATVENSQVQLPNGESVPLPTAVNTVVNTVNNAKSLLNKYSE